MVSTRFGYKHYYIMRYNMRAAAILIFDKCLYIRGRLGLTTARRLLAYMSSRALATITASSLIIGEVLSSKMSSESKSVHMTNHYLTNAILVVTW